MAFARSFFAAEPTSSSRAATCGRSIATFPSCTTRFSTRLPDGCVLDGEIVIATPQRARLRRAAAAAASRRVARREAGAGDPGGVRRVRPARGRRPRRARRAASRAPRRCSSSCWRSATPPIHLTPMTRDPRRGARLALALRRRGSRRRDRQARGRAIPARQARDDQDQARAHRRLRGRRLPLAQERAGRGRLAAARAVRRARQAASRRRDLVLHDGEAQGSWPRSSRRCERARSTITPGASGRRPAAAR